MPGGEHSGLVRFYSTVVYGSQISKSLTLSTSISRADSWARHKAICAKTPNIEWGTRGGGGEKGQGMWEGRGGGGNGEGRGGGGSARTTHPNLGKPAPEEAVHALPLGRRGGRGGISEFLPGTRIHAEVNPLRGGTSRGTGAPPVGGRSGGARERGRGLTLWL